MRTLRLMLVMGLLGVTCHLFVPAVAVGQVVTATLVGTVKDSSGGIIPNAEIVARNTATGIAHQTASDSVGGYEIRELQPGPYTVSARFPGFKETLLTGITLQVNLAARVDITLTPGEVRQTVTVAGQAPVINTENAMVGQVIGENRILDMPLNGRNFMQLTTLTGGIDEGSASNAKNYLNKGYAPAAAGLDATENNYELDGAANQEVFFHSYNYEPSIDAIQEFNIQVGQYSAEFGSGGGAVVNVATKSGTDQIHGSAFEFLRNTDLNARSGYAATVPAYHQNQFGLTVGGPIKKDKAFFFLSYEGYRQLSPTSPTALVPTAADRTGNLSDLGKTLKNPAGGTFAGSVVGPIDPISAAVVSKFYPLPNISGQKTYNYLGNGTAKVLFDNYMGRFDYALSNKNSLTARYGFQKFNRYTPGTFPLIDGVATPQGFQNGVLTVTSNLTPTLLNVARFAYNRSQNDAKEQNNGVPVAYDLGLTLFAGPSVSPCPFYCGMVQSIGLSSTIISGTGAGQYPWFLLGNTFQWYDSIAWTHQHHTVKAGIDLKDIQTFTVYGTAANGESYSFSGQYTGDGFADYLLGDPASETGALAPNAGRRFRDKQIAWYVLDEWKATPKLTLTYGLRYEYYSQPFEKDGLTPVFDGTLGGGIGGLLFPRQNKSVTGNASAQAFFTTYRPDLPFGYLDRTTGWLPDKTNFAPRFSFAYRPTASTNTVIRGGYGWYYSEPQTEDTLGNASVSPPATQWPTLVGNTTTPNLTWNGPVGVSESSFFNTATFGILTGQEQKFPNGYTQQWSLGVSREVKGNLGLTIEYLGSKTTHAITSWDANATSPSALPVQPRLPWPKWGRIFGYSASANANYESLIVSGEKRVGHGLSFVAAYTYGKALASQGADSTSGDYGYLQNPYDRNADYGPTADDITHRVTVSYIYELPFGPGKRVGNGLRGAASKLVGGWNVAGITTAETAFPISVSVPSNNCNDSVYPNLCRPDVIGKAFLGGNGLVSPRWNLNAFDWPLNTAVHGAEPQRYGSAGRNILWGNGSQEWDASLMKDTQILERARLQFRAEFFNLPNHANIGTPNSTLTSPTLFGLTTKPNGGRVVQFGLKILY